MELLSMLYEGGKYHIHDFQLYSITYDYISKEIKLNFETPLNEPFEIRCSNVIAMSTICCDFWGTSLRMDCWRLASSGNRPMVDKCFEEMTSHGYRFSRLKDPKEYVELDVYGVSGDRFKIACEDVVFITNGFVTKPILPTP